MSRFVLALMAAGVVACGGDSGTGPSTNYEQVAGTYAGPMQGVSQGVALSAEFVLTLTQSSGSLSGTFAMDGILTDGIYTSGVSGSGTISGTIASGNNPSVNITIRPSHCTNRTATFSGTFDSANRRLTVQGPVNITDADTCDVLLTYQMVVVLQR